MNRLAKYGIMDAANNTGTSVKLVKEGSHKIGRSNKHSHFRF
ncbi:MAG: hypothetical protein ACLU3F_00430 [Blautia wexlerae]